MNRLWCTLWCATNDVLVSLVGMVAACAHSRSNQWGWLHNDSPCCLQEALNEINSHLATGVANGNRQRDGAGLSNFWFDLWPHRWRCPSARIEQTLYPMTYLNWSGILQLHHGRLAGFSPSVLPQWQPENESHWILQVSGMYWVILFSCEGLSQLWRKRLDMHYVSH